MSVKMEREVRSSVDSFAARSLKQKKKVMHLRLHFKLRENKLSASLSHFPRHPPSFYERDDFLCDIEQLFERGQNDCYTVLARLWTFNLYPHSFASLEMSR